MSVKYPALIEMAETVWRDAFRLVAEGVRELAFDKTRRVVNRLVSLLVPVLDHVERSARNAPLSQLREDLA